MSRIPTEELLTIVKDGFEEQKKIADEVGIDEYLTEFEEWFESNSNGTCTRN